MVGTAVFVGVVLQVPVLRRKLFAWMERLATWHDKGTQEVDVGTMRIGETRGEDMFMLARVGEKKSRS